MKAVDVYVDDIKRDPPSTLTFIFVLTVVAFIYYGTSLNATFILAVVLANLFAGKIDHILFAVVGIVALIFFFAHGNVSLLPFTFYSLAAYLDERIEGDFRPFLEFATLFSFFFLGDGTAFFINMFFDAGYNLTFKLYAIRPKAFP